MTILTMREGAFTAFFHQNALFPQFTEDPFIGLPPTYQAVRHDDTARGLSLGVSPPTRLGRPVVVMFLGATESFPFLPPPDVWSLR